MEVLEIQSYDGRNIYSHRPVIRTFVDLGDLYDVPTKDIEGFNKRLVECFPEIKSHYCSCGYEGGFYDRLLEGTYLAHVTEHLILELQSMMGVDVNYGRTRLYEGKSLYEIIFEYKTHRLAVECLIMGVMSMNKLISGLSPDVDEIMEYLKLVASQTTMGPSTSSIYNAALRKGIPVRKLDGENLLILGNGKHLRTISASLSDTPNCISVDMAGDKHLTKKILSINRIPVPTGEIAYTLKLAKVYAEQIGYPLVIKPCGANQGKGVTLDIKNESAVEGAFNEALKYGNAVIVEKYIVGTDYRVLVVGDMVVAASERRPPSVTGDGRHTIKELVEIENENPMRGLGHEKPLTKILLDNTARRVLEKQGIREEQVIPFGKNVLLRENGNLSTGGTARDCTDEVNPETCKIAVEAAKLLNLDIAGVDITARDISRPLNESGGAVIEVNAAPGLRMHFYPTIGKPRDVGEDIVDMLFPEGTLNSVPIVSITGTNGKTTTTRLISHVISQTGKTVGMTSTAGIYIGDKCISKGDHTGYTSAQVVLSNKNVEAAVLETARGGIIKKGLGYDLADVGVVVNISEDHLGLDGIDTIEGLAHVKSLVIEAVKEEGYSILNADDPMTSLLIEKVKSKLILFSKDKNNKILKDHIRNGGRAVTVADGAICEYKGNGYYEIATIKDIPITLEGFAECNVENSLAAVSALIALNIPHNFIKNGLYSFRPDVKTNPGRFNFFDFGYFTLMLDYGHNIAGYSAAIDCISKIDASRSVSYTHLRRRRCRR